MAELFLSMSGPLARQIVDFYLAHQVLLNLLVVTYGVVLIVGHRNTRVIERTLHGKYGGEDWAEILRQFARDAGAERELASRVRLAFIASPYFFALHRIRKKTIIQVVGKMNGVSRILIHQLANSPEEQLP